MPTPAELGWMAAIVDLRGRVYIKDNQQRVTRQIVLMCESKETRVIRRLSELTGTKPDARQEMKKKDFMRRGCNEHCPEAHVHVNDGDLVLPSIMRWTITGIALAVVLDALESHLIVDKGYMELRDEILASVDLQGRGSGAVMATLIRLGGLGWPMPPALQDELWRIQDRMNQFMIEKAQEVEADEEGSVRPDARGDRVKQHNEGEPGVEGKTSDGA